MVSPISANRVEVCSNCNVFRLALPDTIPAGTHSLNLRIRNLGGPSSFDLLQAHGFGLLEGGICAVIALAWLWVIRRRKLSLGAWWLGVVALFLATSYFLTTDTTIRQMDLAGHEEYIQFLLSHRALPPVAFGWEASQAPLYYVFAASWVALGSVFATIDPWRWTQLFALGIYLIAVATAIATWEKTGFAREAKWFGLALFIFLPAHLFLSARINNDVLMPLWGILVTWLLWEYR